MVLPNRARETTLRNLQTCFPAKTPEEIHKLAKDSLFHTACNMLEMGRAWLRPIEHSLSRVVETDGLEEFRQAYDEGQGVILLAPHLSNWEVFGFFASEGLPSTFMYQPPSDPRVDQLLKRTRSRTGVRMAPTNRKGVTQVMRALGDGELVGILPDQVPADESGVFGQFFGQPAFTMTLVSRLAQRTGAAVICGFAMRLPGRGFRAVFRRVEQSIYSDDLLQSVNAMNRSIEECISLAEGQYQWEYKRFRRQPDDSEFYSQD